MDIYKFTYMYMVYMYLHSISMWHVPVDISCQSNPTMPTTSWGCSCSILRQGCEVSIGHTAEQSAWTTTSKDWNSTRDFGWFWAPRSKCVVSDLSWANLQQSVILHVKQHGFQLVFHCQEFSLVNTPCVDSCCAHHKHPYYPFIIIYNPYHPYVIPISSQ